MQSVPYFRHKASGCWPRSALMSSKALCTKFPFVLAAGNSMKRVAVVLSSVIFFQVSPAGVRVKGLGIRRSLSPHLFVEEYRVRTCKSPEVFLYAPALAANQCVALCFLNLANRYPARVCKSSELKDQYLRDSISGCMACINTQSW